MNESNYQKLVAFHLAADGAVPSVPIIPQAEIMAIRRTLICEEYEEVMAAFDKVGGMENGRPTQALTIIGHMTGTVFGHIKLSEGQPQWIPRSSN